MDKKNLGILFSVLAFNTFTVFAAPEPSWFRNKNAEYPDSRYISYIGSGDTEEEAKAEALGSIALYFNANVKVLQGSITEYIEAVSGGKKQFSKISGINQNVVITSRIDEFLGVRFTSPWHNEQSRRWHILGYIDINEGRQKYDSRIKTNAAMMDSLFQAGEGETEPLRKCGYYRLAAAAARLLEGDIRAQSLMNAGADQYTPLLNSARKITGGYTGLRSQVSFDVRVDSDRDGRVKRKVSEILAKNYSVSPNNALYIITGHLSYSEEQLPAGFFVRASIELALQRNPQQPSGGGPYSEKSVFYTKTYPRQGSMRSWDQAYNAAALKIEKDLEENFIEEFTAFLGG
jgi:hypothetical protein